MENKCLPENFKLVPVEQIIPNPKNPNKHTQEQIIKLSKIISAHGFRRPITVSKRSGFVIVGHGRFEAAKLLDLKELPVFYQDYDNEAQEYQDMVADNAIAEWSSLDLSQIHMDIQDLGPDFDVDLMGFKNFNFEPLQPQNYSEKNKEIDTENFGNDLQHTCPKCGFEFNE